MKKFNINKKEPEFKNSWKNDINKFNYNNNESRTVEEIPHNHKNLDKNDITLTSIPKNILKSLTMRNENDNPNHNINNNSKFN